MKKYRFSELSESAQKTAREEKMASCTIDLHFDWYDYTIDTWRDDLREKGYRDPEIKFSGFWSQGDGACFSCESTPIPMSKVSDCFSKVSERLSEEGKVALAALMVTIGREQILGAIELPCFSIRTSGHYCHSRTMSIEESGDLEVDLAVDDRFDQATIDSLHLHELQDELLVAIEGEFSDLLEQILEEARDLADEIYKSLEQEYEYQTEQECIRLLEEGDEFYDEDGHEIEEEEEVCEAAEISSAP